MPGLAAACPAHESDDPEAGRRVLEEILATVRRIEMHAAHRPDDRLLAAAALRATEAAMAAETLAARQIIIEEITADSYARGRADMAAEVAARKRLRPAS